MSDNRLRLLAVFEILLHYSDSDHFLTSEQILSRLKNDYGLGDFNRKTIYDDIKALTSFLDIDSTKGYALSNGTFDLYEIKLLSDLVDRFRNLSKPQSERLKQKLYSLISVYERQFLESQKIPVIKSNKPDYHLAMINEALRKKEFLLIASHGKEPESIIPYLLYLDRQFYYLFYAYRNYPDRIYKIRIDRITECLYTNEKHYEKDHYQECQKIIRTSINNYQGDDLSLVKLRLINKNKRYIISDLKDRFEDISFNEELDTITIRTTVSAELFALICKYGSSIRIIAPQKLIEAYLDHLGSITELYQPK